MILAVVEGKGSHLPPKSILDIFILNIYHFYMKLKILSVFILLQLIIPGILLALEPAPDITDREVVENFCRVVVGHHT